MIKNPEFDLPNNVSGSSDLFDEIALLAADFFSGAGVLKRWNGTAWVNCTLKVFNGDAWVNINLKYKNASGNWA